MLVLGKEGVQKVFWGSFMCKLKAQEGSLGIVASTPVMAAEWRVELRRGHNVRTGASSG